MIRWKKELVTAGRSKDRHIQQLNLRLTQLEEENDELQHILERERISAAAEKEVAVSMYNSIWAEKEEATNKLVQIEKLVSDLQQKKSSQKDQICRLEQEVQIQRRTIWGVVSSLFVVGAVSLVYALARR